MSEKSRMAVLNNQLSKKVEELEPKVRSRALNSNELYYPNQEEQKIMNDALRASSECIDKGEERC